MSKQMKELLDLSVEELKKQKIDLQDKILKIRFKAKIEPPKNFMEKRESRKQIARINTLLTRYEMSGGAPAEQPKADKKKK